MEVDVERVDVGKDRRRLRRKSASSTASRIAPRARRSSRARQIRVRRSFDVRRVTASKVVLLWHSRPTPSRRWRRAMRSTLATLIIVWAISTPLAAQWLKEPTRGMPRTADGKPDLSAPRRAPRTANRICPASGEWMRSLRWQSARGSEASGNSAVGGRTLQAADGGSRARTIRRRSSVCRRVRARSMAQAAGPGSSRRRWLIAILYENLSHRQIFLDGRELPRDPHPSFMGYSVGRWEGDTLVVESHRIQGHHVARLRRASSHRGASRRRTVTAGRVRPHRVEADVRGSRRCSAGP